MVGALALLTPPGVVEAQSHSASRAFQRTGGAPGSDLRVTITASNYGAFGQVEETLPEGFTFKSASLPVAEEGQVVRFSLFGDSSFTYVVTVPTAEGQYTFNGVVKNADRQERTISGHRQFRVGPPPTPAPTSTPTPEPTATATPEPTRTPTPEPTATPEPTETPNPSPTSAPTATSTPSPTPTPVPPPTPAPTAMPSPEPTATPGPTVTPVPIVVEMEEDGGPPALLWLLLAMVGVGLLAAFMAYLRWRR